MILSTKGNHVRIYHLIVSIVALIAYRTVIIEHQSVSTVNSRVNAFQESDHKVIKLESQTSLLGLKMSNRIGSLTTQMFLNFINTIAYGKDNFTEKGLRNEITAEYFSSSFEEAREKFLRACRTANANIESFKNPNTGTGGALLFTDVAIIGPKDVNNILVLGSGTHGIEGFVGSAIQTGLLQEDIAKGLNPDTSILIIHAINPYGFAYLRRWNEDNIDINRNFWDHSNPYPSNPGYEQLADAIDPKSISFWANVKSCFRLLWYALMNGTKRLKEAIVAGQYTHPQGIFFGGTFDTWSNKIIREIVSRYLVNAKRVIIVDFHTGLGPYGNAEIILNENEQSSAYKRSVEWWGDRVKTTASGEAVSIHLQGTLKLAFPKMLPDTEVTAVSLEFGTLSALKVFWALRAENWLHHYGGKEHPDARRLKDELLRAFYPDSDEWKILVWKQGKDIVEQALAHLAES